MREGFEQMENLDTTTISIARACGRNRRQHVVGENRLRLLKIFTARALTVSRADHLGVVMRSQVAGAAEFKEATPLPSLKAKLLFCLLPSLPALLLDTIRDGADEQ